MRTNRRAWVCGCVVSLVIGAAGQPLIAAEDKAADAAKGKIRLIIRMDDPGFCHAANMALKRVLEEGVATSVSVLVTTPWLDEVVEILRDHPEISVGVHLALNSEWREYRWGPVSPHTEVPTLVDAFGRLYGSRREFMAHGPALNEVARELRAQIELAIRKGLRISYCDNHMGTALSTREFQDIVEKLTLEYHIGISRYFGEQDTPKVYSVPPEGKLDAGIRIIEELSEPGLYLLVVHPGLDTPEMAAMTDLNVTGLKQMSKHRQAVTDMLCHPRFKAAIEAKGIELVTYEQLRAEGLHRMKRPANAAPYEKLVQEARQGQEGAGY